jgi:hypothetical protein
MNGFGMLPVLLALVALGPRPSAFLQAPGAAPARAASSAPAPSAPQPKARTRKTVKRRSKQNGNDLAATIRRIANQ